MSGDLATIIHADITTRGLPPHVLLAEAGRPEVAAYRKDYAYIAGYASSALRSVAIGDDSNARTRACAVALMLCKRTTFEAISAAAAEMRDAGVPEWTL